LLAWSSRQTTAATASPNRVCGPAKCDTITPPPCAWLPFAQRLRIARRNIRILRIGADGGEDFPRARAFRAFGKIGKNRHAGNVRKTKRAAGPFVLHEC